MNKKGNTSIILIIIAVLTIGALLYFKTNIMQLSQNTVPTIQTSEPKRTTEEDKLKSYTSQDLKISFEYPDGWYVDEKDLDIMITSYMTKIGENKSPRPNEIKIFIDNFNGCHDSIEGNLIDPACGEGGPTVAKNKIITIFGFCKLPCFIQIYICHTFIF